MKREEKLKVIARSLRKHGYGLSLPKDENVFLAEKILNDLATADKKSKVVKKVVKKVAKKTNKKAVKKSSKATKKASSK